MGCRRVAGQHELERVTRSDDGSLRLGRTLPGRGAWLCIGSLACLDVAAKRRAFARAFRAPVEPEAIAALRTELTVRHRPTN